MDKDKTGRFYFLCILLEGFLAGFLGFTYYILPMGVFIPVVFYFERRDAWTAAALAMLSGLVRDLTSAEMPGVSVVSYLLAFFFSVVSVKRFGRDSEIWLVIQLILAALFENICRVLVYNYMLQGNMLFNWKIYVIQAASAFVLGVLYVTGASYFLKNKGIRGKLKF